MARANHDGSRKCRILHVTQSVGGIETYLLILFRHIDRRRFDLALACPTMLGTLARNAADLGVKIYPVDLAREISPIRDMRGLADIMKAIHRYDPDIVHVHSSKAGVLGRLACFLLNRKCYYTPHAFAYLGETGLRRWCYLTIEKVMTLTRARILATSESEKRRAMREVGVAAEAVHVFPNSLDVKEIAKEELGTTKTGLTALMVGRLVKQKNPEMFLRVAARVRRKIPETTFVLVGAGFPDYTDKNLLAMAETAQSRGDVRVVSWMGRKELLAEMQRADIVVVPSRFESFGYVAAEAQLLGKPVVACDVDGLREIVEHESTGILVRPDDDEAMDRAIRRLLKDGMEARAMGIRGRERIQRLFSIEGNIHILEEFYLGLHHTGEDNSNPREERS